MAAPVCHLPGTVDTTQPTLRRPPSIPVATDLASALNAINSLRRWVQQQGTSTFNNGTNNPGTLNATTKKESGWVEESRNVVKETVDIDGGGSVTFSVVKQIVMKNKGTGESLTIKGA